MILLSASNLCKNYGTDVILKNISFHINKGEHIGIVGENGAGKTTLISILTGKTEADSGEVFVSNSVNLGYLEQNEHIDSDATVYEYALSIFKKVTDMEKEMERLHTFISENSHLKEETERAFYEIEKLEREFEDRGGYSYKSKIDSVLSAMSIGKGYYHKKISALSGGERTRLLLACVLLTEPELLFLDEPTNHLDIHTLHWLENYLKNYKGTLVLVSHDRYFLDETVNKIFEIENHELNIYNGNYSYYTLEAEKRREIAQKTYKAQMDYVKKQEDIIRRFKERGTEKLAKRAASREKALARMDIADRPNARSKSMGLKFNLKYESGRDVFEGTGIGKTYGYGAGGREVFKNMDFNIKRGEKICIVGYNGVGKTTFLKILVEDISPSRGTLKVGHNVDIGYYDQSRQKLDDEKTVFQEVHDDFPLMSNGEVRGMLGRFLFDDSQVNLKVGQLSGGEKGRLSLLKLMMGGHNVLLLDEPTNHLDIKSKEAIERAIREFPGTVIAVSHDRYFLNRIADKIFEVTKNGIKEYHGDYSYYIEKKEREEVFEKADSIGEESTLERVGLKESGILIENAHCRGDESAFEERRRKKEEEAQKRRAERRRLSLEEEMKKLEVEIEEIHKDMCREENFSDPVAIKGLAEREEEAKKLLLELEEEWLSL